MKVTREFVKQAYTEDNTVLYYARAVTKVGLWESERILSEKYLKDKNGRILDLGCGAGRIAIGLYKLGYHNVTGIDLSDSMIDKARQISVEMKCPISFDKGDAVNLQFEDKTFDLVIFSFNGLMLIPGIESRIKAMSEIQRVLNPGGHFIFTTHDRDMQKEMKSFWKKEKKRWRKGLQDSRLYDLGDRIIQGKAERTFLHFPNREEIASSLR